MPLAMTGREDRGRLRLGGLVEVAADACGGTP
jgi:hypothetical protein